MANVTYFKATRRNFKPGGETGGFAAAIVRCALLVMGLAFLLPASALAQGGDFSGILPSGAAIQGRGWTQLQNYQEISEFLLGLVELVVLVALIAYHPRSLASRRSEADFKMPQMLFLYGLIGMIIGFIVMHHGYVIGFVIFGIGGLLRFRTNVETTTDTTRMILATLIGLCVGLDLPLMAVITTISAWLILMVVGRSSRLKLELQFSDRKATLSGIELLKGRLADQGFAVVSARKTKFKSSADFVLLDTPSSNHETLNALVETAIAENELAVTDWHIS